MDITNITGWITQFGIILGAVIGAWRIVDKHVIKRVSDLERTAGDLTKQAERLRADIKDGAERDKLVIDGVLACLKCLREKGHGGVSSKIVEIEGYMTKQACRTAGG